MSPGKNIFLTPFFFCTCPVSLTHQSITFLIQFFSYCITSCIQLACLILSPLVLNNSMTSSAQRTMRENSFSLLHALFMCRRLELCTEALFPFQYITVKKDNIPMGDKLFCYIMQQGLFLERKLDI